MVASGGSFLAFLAAAILVIYPDTLDDDEDEDDEEPGPSSVKSEAASNNSTEKHSVLKSMPRNSSSKPEVESSVWVLKRKILEFLKYQSQNAQAS